MKLADRSLPLFEDYTLDRVRGCLMRGRQEVHLRPQAYQLLKFLAENRGVLIEKDQLIQEIWQGRAVGDDSLVQCLRDVRHSLGEGGTRYIRTVRGRGYIFDVAGDAVEGRLAIPDENDVAVEDQTADSLAALRTGEVPSAPGELTRSSALSASNLGAILVLAALLLGGVATVYGYLRGRAPARRPIQSIAVLPFVNETGDRDTEYLADGSTESLINSLAQVPEVAVKSRSTVFRFKGRHTTPQAVAAELSVEAVVDGRVVRREDSLTVSLALVDGTTGDQVWGEHYIYPIGDLPSMQREMAADLLGALHARAPKAQPGALASGYSPNGDAYLLYLRGRYHFFKTSEAEVRTAIGFFQRAIEVDQSYALAHAGLADAYRALAIVGHIPSTEAFPKSRAAAIRALELDHRLAEAHTSLGWVRFYFDWDWAAAERDLQTAIGLSPGSADAHRAYAHLLSNQARHAEALVEIERARELDPRSLLTNIFQGQFLFYAGQYDEAERRYRRTLEIEPNYWVAHQGLGRVYVHRGLFPEAIAALRKALELSSNACEPITQLGYALARSGRIEEARSVYRTLEQRSREQYVPAYSFAMISNGMGDADAALRGLERSVAAREVQATFIKIDTRWDALRPDPRFIALLKRMHLTP